MLSIMQWLFLSLVCTVMPCYGPFIKISSHNTLVLIINYHNDG